MTAATYKGLRELRIAAECLQGELRDRELWHAVELMEDVCDELKHRSRVAYAIAEADEVDAYAPMEKPDLDDYSGFAR